MNKFSSETKEQIQRIICWYTQCSICKQCGLPRSHVCSCDEAMKILDDKGYAKYIKKHSCHNGRKSSTYYEYV